jgi:NAD+ kinase
LQMHSMRSNVRWWEVLTVMSSAIVCCVCTFVQVPANARGHVWASFDGKDRTQLGPGDAVVMRLSKWPVPSVAAEADPSSDWFSAVRECLHWNMRKVQGGAGQ